MSMLLGFLHLYYFKSHCSISPRERQFLPRVSRVPYLAGVNDGFELQRREGAPVGHGARQGQAVGDIGRGDTGQRARLNHEVRVVLPDLG